MRLNKLRITVLSLQDKAVYTAIKYNHGYNAVTAGRIPNEMPYLQLGHSSARCGSSDGRDRTDLIARGAPDSYITLIYLNNT